MAFSKLLISIRRNILMRVLKGVKCKRGFAYFWFGKMGFTALALGFSRIFPQGMGQTLSKMVKGCLFFVSLRLFPLARIRPPVATSSTSDVYTFAQQRRFLLAPKQEGFRRVLCPSWFSSKMTKGIHQVVCVSIACV